MIRVRPFVAAAFAITLAPVLVPAAVSPETGSYIFRRYLHDQYGASPENWGIAQDRRGIMYFANTAALLEFDGQSWRPIRLSNRSAVRSVVVDSSGACLCRRSWDLRSTEARPCRQYAVRFASR